MGTNCTPCQARKKLAAGQRPAVQTQRQQSTATPPTAKTFKRAGS